MPRMLLLFPKVVAPLANAAAESSLLKEADAGVGAGSDGLVPDDNGSQYDSISSDKIDSVP